MRLHPAIALLAALSLAGPGRAAETKPPAKDAKADKAAEKKTPWSSETWSGLALRGIGPAITSGRVVDIAVDPTDKSRWFVAAAYGGVWKTTNNGTSFTPVFDGEGTSSIGCVTIDPNNPNVVWVGTGENNSQRSVGWGDGVYRSEDGGKSWTNMGLKTSEHIGKIVVHPKDSRVVYVASQGPLWAPGGERGLYKTTDAGKTWKAALTVSENTGVSDVVMDPRDPELLWATTYQRRRHVWTLVHGGPESAIHKSTDGGGTWKKVKTGLPKEELGRIGLAQAPTAPDTLYAVVEAANKAGGFFRSTDRGETWEKRSEYVPGGPQYYNEIWVDPQDADRVYSVDVYFKVTDDAGKTFKNLGESWKHVDNHSIWIDPDDTRHYLVGCDGGVYESFDRAATWVFKSNLPITQFYRATPDEAYPVYRVYGGTQDNFTLGGPSRVLNETGIQNSDWIVTVEGDGFQTRIDPKDPDTVYSQSQHGVLQRFDRKTGEKLLIQPQSKPGEDALRWNWDSPLVISAHRNTRLYFAAQRVFRTDDRGESWTAISGDLTRQIDRDKLKVMGKIWPADAVAKNSSTSFYGNIVSLAESPKDEKLLYVGTDDGLVQVTEDGGATWRKVDRFPGVPENAYVSRLLPSQHDANAVYVSFDNHKMGDFRPYVLKSLDRGKTWTSVASDLPTRSPAYALAEDHVERDLLFAGTEFGLYFTRDGGKAWLQLKGNFPVASVRDLEIQRRENDLVVGTFSRGIYILDDYTPLRHARPADLEKDALTFPVKKPLVYVPALPLGVRGKGFLGETLYTADNPPFGAIFTFYLKEEAKTRKERRHEIEKEKGDAAPYPTAADFHAEAAEEEPSVVVTVKDATGAVVRRLTAPNKAGIQRIAWDLRYAKVLPISLEAPRPPDPWDTPQVGPMVPPGRYTFELARRVDGKLQPVGEPQTFEAVGVQPLPDSHRQALLAFSLKVARLQRAALGASESVDEVQRRIDHVKKALLETPAAQETHHERARSLEARLRALKLELRGDDVLARRNFPTPPAILDRMQRIVDTQWYASAAPTKTSLDEYRFAGEAFVPWLAKLKQLDADLHQLEDTLETAGAPWTPGRLPTWTME